MVRKYPHQFPLPRLLLNSEITIPPIHNQTITNNATTFTGAATAGKQAEETNFDSNMMIILAALLCALICALSLNSIVRCVLRCGRRFPYDDSSDGRRSRSGSKGGLTKDVLRRIPVVAYETGKDVKSATDCAICLTEFEEGERVRVLPECGHGFHVMCIDTWLRSHSSCPTCRQLLSHHSV